MTTLTQAFAAGFSLTKRDLEGYEIKGHPLLDGPKLTQRELLT